jgi:hypothetical protein
MVFQVDVYSSATDLDRRFGKVKVELLEAMAFE